jgi:L-alanine-DL-glutamate epimerase-like enolase superfamily enzyme
LTAESSVPICSDEGVHSMSDILSIIFNKSSNGISLKTIKLGGMIDVLESAIYASTKNISINLAGKVAETSISSYAIANIARCIPQMDWDLSITNQYLEEDPVINPLLIDNGNILLTDLIGLGAELNMEVAHKYIKYV